MLLHPGCRGEVAAAGDRTGQLPFQRCRPVEDHGDRLEGGIVNQAIDEKGLSIGREVEIGFAETTARAAKEPPGREERLRLASLKCRT